MSGAGIPTCRSLMPDLWVHRQKKQGPGRPVIGLSLMLHWIPWPLAPEATAPAVGVEIRADFEFGVPVRSDTDHMAGIIETFRLHRSKFRLSSSG